MNFHCLIKKGLKFALNLKVKFCCYIQYDTRHTGQSGPICLSQIGQ
jgi:hypothetical protein